MESWNDERGIRQLQERSILWTVSYGDDAQSVAGGAVAFYQHRTGSALVYASRDEMPELSAFQDVEIETTSRVGRALERHAQRWEKWLRPAAVLGAHRECRIRTDERSESPRREITKACE